MSNVREDCEMKPNWKKWIDLIYQNFPDMLIFDIDALVDKNGKEYILEVNGSCQGFSPEHGEQDLEHLRDLVLRKMEIILGLELLKDDNEAKTLFVDNNDKKVKINEKLYEKDTEIVNLKNTVDDYKKKLNTIEHKYKELKDRYQNKNKKIFIYILSFIILILCIFLFKNGRNLSLS